jgi:ABC transporter substrate binding protein
MRRREFLTLLGGTAASWPLAARGQQPERVRRIGVLMSSAADDPETPARVTVIAQGLQELGWTVGRNVRIDYRWGAGDIELFRKYAAELVALKPDVILATAGSIVGALQQESRTVPIVFVTTVDPVGGGWVESLARPGGNATGFTSYEFSMSGKRLELLKETAPLTRRVAVIRDPRVPAGSGGFAAIQTAAPGLGGGSDSDRCARRRGDRAWRLILRAGRERWLDRGRTTVIHCASSRSDHRIGGPSPTAGGLHEQVLRHLRWSDLLRYRYY